MQRLGKHFPVDRQQILNNAVTGPPQWKSSIFYVVRVVKQGVLELSSELSSALDTVKRGPERASEDEESPVRSRCQGTTR
jgi:hypothetical protein